jgi:hypothetical protein
MDKIDIQLAGQGFGYIEVIGHTHLDEEFAYPGFRVRLISLDLQGLGKSVFIYKAGRQEISAKPFMPTHGFSLHGSV